ncbi:hypothetical protein P3S68_027068 [Capsicum galapagoense]
MNLNASTTLSLAPQYKSTTFTTAHTFCACVAQPSTKTSTLAINPMIVLPQSTSESTFNTLYDHCYTLKPTVKLSGPPKFLTKKPRMLEELEKVVGKVKSVENDMKNSPGLMGYGDVSYKYWGMSSSVNLPPSFETSKFGEPDGQKDSVKHLGRHCNQLRETEGKKKENAPIVMLGPKQSLREFAKRRKEKDNFTPIGESYASLFQRLVQQGMITLLLGIEDCRALKREIEKMIQDKSIMVQNIDSEESSSHVDIQISG